MKLLLYAAVFVFFQGTMLSKSRDIGVCAVRHADTAVNLSDVNTWLKRASLSFTDAGVKFKAVRILQYDGQLTDGGLHQAIGACPAGEIPIVFSNGVLASDAGLREEQQALGATDPHRLIVILKYSEQTGIGKYAASEDGQYQIVHTLEHELGHYFLGLGHNSDPADIMYPQAKKKTILGISLFSRMEMGLLKAQLR